MLGNVKRIVSYRASKYWENLLLMHSIKLSAHSMEMIMSAASWWIHRYNHVGDIQQYYNYHMKSKQIDRCVTKVQVLCKMNEKQRRKRTTLGNIWVFMQPIPGFNVWEERFGLNQVVVWDRYGFVQFIIRRKIQ